MNSPEWTLEARCAEVDPELFFPEVGGPVHYAKLICAGCEVREQCLDFAVENNEHYGIWGGTSEKQRQRIRAGKKSDAA